MPVIDSHCHLGRGTRKQVELSSLLKQMDALGIERAVLCTVDQFIAVRNREGNDEIIAAVRDHPDRFWGLAAVNPWFEQAGVDELKRCLDCGLVGLKLNSHLQGFLLSDPLVHPLIDVCYQHEAVVYAHTGTPITSEPFQLAELAQTFPDVPMIMGHMGFTDFWYDAVPAGQLSNNIYLESSLIDTMNFANAVHKLGAERVLFGTDYPETDMSLELEKVHMIDINDEQRSLVIGDNAMKLFGGRSRT